MFVAALLNVSFVGPHKVASDMHFAMTFKMHNRFKVADSRRDASRIIMCNTLAELQINFEHASHVRSHMF